MKPADLSKIQRSPISQRKNLVKVKDFTKVPEPGTGFLHFLECLPLIKHRTNAATSLATVIKRILCARDNSRTVSWGLGPHVVKYGLTPLIVELMNYDVVQHVLTNGAGAIHDVEIAMIGETSEEMGGHISTGTFGMAHETGDFINSAAVEAMETKQGFGYIIGKKHS